MNIHPIWTNKGKKLNRKLLSLFLKDYANALKIIVHIFIRISIPFPLLYILELLNSLLLCFCLILFC